MPMMMHVVILVVVLANCYELLSGLWPLFCVLSVCITRNRDGIVRRKEMG